MSYALNPNGLKLTLVCPVFPLLSYINPPPCFT